MIGRFKSYNKLISRVNYEIQNKNEDLEWYKYKVEQIANRLALSNSN